MQVLTEVLHEVGLYDAPVRVWGERIEDRGAQISFSPLGQHAPVAEKARWFNEHNDIRKKLHEILTQSLPHFSIAMGGMTTIDITHKGITKAYGIRKLSELTNIPVPDMLYVGDALEEGGNDAIVVETGVPVRQVLSPEETAALIQTVVSDK